MKNFRLITLLKFMKEVRIVEMKDLFISARVFIYTTACTSY